MDNLTFYRKSAALEFSPARKSSTSPTVFVKFAQSLYEGDARSGQPKFGWQDAIILALKPRELLGLARGCALAGFENDETNLWSAYHEPPGGGLPKSIDLTRAQDSQNYTAFLSVRAGERRVSVGLDLDDLYMLEQLLPYAAAAIMGWVTSEVPEWVDADYDRPESVYREEEPAEGPVEEYWEQVTPEERPDISDGELAVGKIRALWQEKIQRGTSGEVSDGQMKLLRWKLTDVFDPEPTKNQMAKVVIKQVFNADSSNDLDSAMVSALLDWLLLPRRSNTEPIAYRRDAPVEARAIARMGG